MLKVYLTIFCRFNKEITNGWQRRLVGNLFEIFIKRQ